jgi:hypothetical protein
MSEKYLLVPLQPLPQPLLQQALLLLLLLPPLLFFQFEILLLVRVFLSFVIPQH